ncbi:PREDICTED: EPIDERMAL PATTERNING FACTOR-like protein 2 [Ipomoea nil]|uniref:EPIDERMAL PATTERNING FACTOR-like protein 2 n=1 Tax=Ipomoea nil TaxID=35883 RepID=UPI0009012D2B|nr:PREDICTED: EPIDERMAL PATTERNING FACTOR-like protein 2 [Ipomoea nil]
MSCTRALSLLIFLICSSSYLEARRLLLPAANPKAESEEKMILRGQIGSRPPRCQRRCSSCQHCEAIQVPTNPQRKSGDTTPSSSSRISRASTDDNYSSNYKPMSWKCKCGNLIFNP